MGPCHSVTFKVLFVWHAYFFFGMCYLQHKYTTPCVELLYLKNLKQPTRVPIEHLLISFPQNAKTSSTVGGFKFWNPSGGSSTGWTCAPLFSRKKNRPYFPWNTAWFMKGSFGLWNNHYITGVVFPSPSKTLQQPPGDLPFFIAHVAAMAILGYDQVCRVGNIFPEQGASLACLGFFWFQSWLGIMNSWLGRYTSQCFF